MYFFVCYIFCYIPVILADGDLQYNYFNDATRQHSITNGDVDLKLLIDSAIEKSDGQSLILSSRIRRSTPQAHPPPLLLSGGKYQEQLSNVTLITAHDAASGAGTALDLSSQHLNNSGITTTVHLAEHPILQDHNNIINVTTPTTEASKITVHTLSTPVEIGGRRVNNNIPVDDGANENHSTILDNHLPQHEDEFHDFQTYPVEFNGTFNGTVFKEHNITKKYEDSHTYYNSSRFDDPQVGQHYWVDLSNDDKTVTNGLLSNSYRRASTVPLPFKFPFYGHEIENITIATGGFIYTGDYVHSWLAATQYIAPLMANFDTTISKESYIKYGGNATSFTVLWENVSLQDKPNSGYFTFQATLHSNGDIVFVYKSIPNVTADIQDENHPVKVGLSDAYILDRTIFFVRRKTIFEYHRVHFDKKTLRNWTVIYLKPEKTCLSKTTCKSCLAGETVFNCQWCDGRCSTGIDRLRHDWMKKSCDIKKISHDQLCKMYEEKNPTAGAHKSIIPNGSGNERSSTSASTVFLTLMTLACIMCIVVWSVYAYRNPHSTSGQILIKYRPSQWSSWRKGEARYTAATTIHM